MNEKTPSISVFFPFLNDWGTVGSLVGLAVATVSRLTDDWEVLIIDDGSNFGDKKALEAIISLYSSSDPDGKSGESRSSRQARTIKRIRIITHEKNRGYGGALRSGFENSTKDLIFYTDCDAQYDPREFVKLYEVMRPAFVSNKSGLRRGEVGMVNGFKIKRNDPWIRIVAGRIYHYVVKFMFDLPIRDTDCDFRLIRKEVFNSSTSSGRTAVRLFESTGTICTELVKKIDHAGYKIVEVPVHHYWRTSGKSQFFNFKRLAKTGINLLKLWWKLMVKKEYYK